MRNLKNHTMKKLILFSFISLLSSMLMAQADCSDLIISEYVEGWSNNKSVEIYNPTPDPIDLSAYRLIRWSNGDETADQDSRYVLPLTGTIPSYGVIVMIQDTNFPGQDTMIDIGLKQRANYMAPANYDAGTPGCRVVFWNGDDAVSLQHLISDTWTDIDIFGEIGVRPLNWQGTTDPVGAWDDNPPYADGQGNYLTKDQTLVRKSTVKVGIDRDAMDLYGPNSFYALAEYDSLPNDTFDSLGFHHCDCKPSAVFELPGEISAAIYPNPVTTGEVSISSDVEMSRIQLLSLFGQLIDEKLVAGRQVSFTLPTGLGRGVYLVRIYDTENRSAARKLMIY
jgi:hypothetical protein